MTTYAAFIERKLQPGGNSGFAPLWMPDFLFDFQRALVEWALLKGRAAIFADCGLGKTPMQLVWAENVKRHTNKSILILTPLSVGAQTVREGAKFGIECVRSRDGKVPAGASIVVTNYGQLPKFSSSDFAGCVADESSILKNFDGVIRGQITEFMRTLPYRLLCTATAAPNDYIELGTSSEAVGDLGYMDMLNRFFKRTENYSRLHDRGGQGWRFRGHAEQSFWRWICSWARAIRKPSDMGCDDGAFRLPSLSVNEHIIQSKTKRRGFMFNLPAITLNEQREERRRTLPERCECAASLVIASKEQAICWCHLNDEGKTLTRLIPDATEICGDDPDERKEEVFTAFQDGKLRVIVTKPVIGGFGLNLQNCAHQTFFPSHSYEQWYQAVRRSWRFGQTKPVRVDVIASEGERGVLANLRRKEAAATAMFDDLIQLMGNELHIQADRSAEQKEKIPAWL